jgi:hypothetical protein
MKPLPICTHCGRQTTCTEDHVIPQVLFAARSDGERSIKVKSCANCNHHSNETILRGFFAMLDTRFHQKTLDHFRRPDARADIEEFRSACSFDSNNLRVVPNSEITAKLTKMFMGLRRKLMGEAWYFLPRETFRIYKIDPGLSGWVSRPLPFPVGYPTTGIPLTPDLAEDLSKPMRHKFRDFEYEILANDSDGMAIGLQYTRTDFLHLGNRLELLCFVPSGSASDIGAEQTYKNS